MKLISWLLLLASLCYGRTTVADTLLRADGSAYRGTFRVRWSTYTASGGATIQAGYVDVPVAINGTFSISLDANTTSSPMNTAYTVTYNGLRQGATTTEYWVVPEAANPLTIANVRSSALPAAGAVVALSLLNSGGASTGNCLLWSGSSNTWTPGACASGLSFSQAFTAQTSVTATHAFGTANVIVTVLDATNKRIIPKQWTVDSVNAVTVTFDVAKTGTIYIR